MSEGLARAWRSHGELALLGTGAALPGSPVTTETLLGRAGLDGRRHALGLSVAERLGVRTRHLGRSWSTRIDTLGDGAGNPALAAQAVEAALRDAGLQVADLGYLIAHTATPAQPLPSNVAFVADRLGFAGPHIELRQACTGFANALMIAFGLLAAPGARPVAIVGSETGSVFLDIAALADESGQIVNLVQMGDGAGAVILGPAGSGSDRLRAAWYGALGLGRGPGLQMREGGSDRPGPGDAGPLSFEHDFAAVLRGGAELFDAGVGAAAARGFDLAAADWIIPHQASGRIGQQLAGHFDLPEDRFFVNADRIGNTGSAAIWIALAELRARRLAAGTVTLALGAEATKYMFGGFVHEAG
ncbi:3-oxoacyl-ACP synthase III family protein [Sphingomonas sp. PAMC 26605]|uniref:3-oxoacyl-ACP synthase III family protein n=1 Tax=Sphingomonas sp. PAMC 26605 TaxID=1112214 RepID=UPI00026CCAEB|nr:3-oxoacyl-[acyl-carrier-protein] synthase III C-terminal domain-containing protein [Sphingomonas sp. PAMC 26605]